MGLVNGTVKHMVFVKNIVRVLLNYYSKVIYVYFTLSVISIHILVQSHTH
jgi:hypothetical protein